MSNTLLLLTNLTCLQSRQNGQLIILRMFNTPGQELREQFMRDRVVQENHFDDVYLSQLKELGVKPHPSVFPAYFRLKNGLKYPGMATTQRIGGQEVLLRVPEELILSSIKALRQPALQEVFSEQFYHDSKRWEDRVLNTYCLYLHGTNAKENIFYQMIQHLSKDIDIAPFWDEKQISLFRDKIMQTSAQLELKLFKQEWEGFQAVREKHEILQGPAFNQQNYQWIFTHITSRCFGRRVDRISFVPFCEFFNHHCTHAYYKVNAELKKQVTDISDNLSDVSSSGTCESGDYIEEGQFDYDLIEVPPSQWDCQYIQELNQEEGRAIGLHASQILHRIDKEVSWKDFSIIFVGHLIDKVKFVENQFAKGAKDFASTTGSLKNLQKILEKYILLIQAFYKEKFGMKHKYVVNNWENLEQKQIKPFVRPDPFTYTVPFTEFTLQTKKKDYFNPNQQVFFSYGKNSNQLLLLRYGFAIEGNKYESVTISFDLDCHMQDMPDLFQLVQKMNISLRRRFRVNHTRLNLELIIFHRLNSWNLLNIDNVDQIFYVFNIEQQLHILEQVKESLEYKLSQIGSEGEINLNDENIGYHEYFIGVYHEQKVRILKKQINLMEKLKQVLSKMGEGISREQCESTMLTKSETFIFRHYLDTIVI